MDCKGGKKGRFPNLSTRQDNRTLRPQDGRRHRQLMQLERQAAARGIKPLDEATLDAMGDVWPEDENIDDFLAWLRQSRREGK